jgi:hypothetical protein
VYGEFGTSFTITFDFKGGASNAMVVSIPSVSEPGTTEFFGFQSSLQDIDSVTVQGGNGSSAYANFTFTSTGAGTAIPEPSQFVPLTGALGLLYVLRRWRTC